VAPVTAEPAALDTPVTPAVEQAEERYEENLAALQDKLNDANTPDEIAAVKAEIAALKNKYATLLGRLQAEATRANTAETRLSALDMTSRTWEERASNAEKERDELLSHRREQERKVKLAGLDEGDEISDDEVNEFDPKDVRLIRGLTKKQLVPVIKTLLAEVDDLKNEVGQLRTVGQRVADIDKTHQELAVTSAAQAEREYFSQRLTPHFPQWESWTKTPEWKEFLASAENDDPNVKKGHTLAHYRKAKFVPGIVALFKEFQLRNESSGNQRFKALATPAKQTANAQTPSVKPKMKSSEYVKYLNSYTKSKSISRTQWETYKASFHAAQKEGRIDDDAGIFNR
jgi:FtsZ-binding cell division protein ZapB